MEALSFISQQRKRLGMTQHQLARLAGVSQSLVAKIESGRVDAAYSKVKAIMEALERSQLASERTARQIMHSGVQGVAQSETLHSVSEKMRKGGISQMPVVEGRQAVGSISEQAILQHFSADPQLRSSWGGRGRSPLDQKKTAKMLVADAMEEPFPSVPPSTPISSVASLLRHHPAVLVTEMGRIAGIITKSDLLKTI